MAGDRGSDSPRDTDAGVPVPLDVIPLHSTNLLTVLDGTGIIRYESPSIERIFGYGQDELVGEQVAEYFHPDDRAGVMNAYRHVVESSEYARRAVEYRHEQADGSYRWVESVASANPTPEGYYVVNTCDISDRKARERELERTNERLGEFASVVSHDLRNPLSVVQGRVELAQAECDSPHLDHAADAVDRCLVLIDDLLSFAREGREATAVEPVSLATIVDQCRWAIETADATFLVETEQTIHADPSRLKQLLENLIRNAVEHGDEDTTVTISDLDDGFYVADDGPGIPGDERDRVFEVGYSTADGGTGFGLGIVKQIADAHDWAVGVTASDDGGARVEITGVDIDT